MRTWLIGYILVLSLFITDNREWDIFKFCLRRKCFLRCNLNDEIEQLGSVLVIKLFQMLTPLNRMVLAYICRSFTYWYIQVLKLLYILYIVELFLNNSWAMAGNRCNPPHNDHSNVPHYHIIDFMFVIGIILLRWDDSNNYDKAKFVLFGSLCEFHLLVWLNGNAFDSKWITPTSFHINVRVFRDDLVLPLHFLCPMLFFHMSHVHTSHVSFTGCFQDHKVSLRRYPVTYKPLF